MKTEQQLKELLEKIEKVSDDEELDDYFDLTNKGGFWLDFLDWVLEK